MKTHTTVFDSRAALHRQHGAVLIVALLFLVILTMLGLTAMSGTTMEERMSGNSRDINIALQAAEAALRDARRDINRLPISGAGRPDIHFSLFGDPNGTTGTCNSASSRGLCRPAPYVGEADAVMPPSLDIATQTFATYGDFTGAPEMKATVGGTRNARLAQQPRYLVEAFCLPTRGVDSMGGPPGAMCKWYRITARGYGVNPNSQVTLQEMFLSL